jgi:phosphoenolpyruvate synthase/pyruvate phosphate dikinase
MFVAAYNEEYREYENCNAVRNKIPIGEMMMLSSNMLKVDGKIPTHNLWFFKFGDMFDEAIDRIRFIELRPKRK